jgi:hypothetical protein
VSDVSYDIREGIEVIVANRLTSPAASSMGRTGPPNLRLEEPFGLRAVLGGLLRESG